MAGEWQYPGQSHVFCGQTQPSLTQVPEKEHTPIHTGTHKASVFYA